MITTASNMIMNSVGKGYQGMVSSLTSLERFAPLTLGIAFANLVFIQAIEAITKTHEVTQISPANIKLQLITAGFDIAFFCSFIIAIIILILALFARQEIYPDYQQGKDNEIQTGIP